MSLRDARIEAARLVLGWEYKPMGEYADAARDVLGEVVDAVMAVGGDTDVRPSSLDGDLFGLPGGTILATHRETACAGQACVIHNPSDHHMRDWPLNWRGDRGLMERLCPCGVGHPDPDDLAHKERTCGADAARREGVHGCCGCCRRVA